MIQVIHGDSAVFDALVYGRPAPSTLNYIEAQFPVMSQQLTDAGRAFHSNTLELYERFNGSEAMRVADAALRKVGGLFQPNRIRYLESVSEIQNAPVAMQRWIMAQPDIRAAYHAQRCDGYSPTYVDMYPGQVGANHYDYRQVMHGIAQDHEEDDFKVTFFMDDLEDGDVAPTHLEKVDILSTWDIVQAALKRGKDDPTSPFADQL